MERDRVVAVTKKTNILLKRIARASAWALLAAVIVAVVSGWGITQTDIIYRLSFGLINRGTADAIHRVANIPLAFFFLSHVFVNIRLMIPQRSRFSGLLVSIVLGTVGAGLLAIMIYMELFRVGG